MALRAVSVKVNSQNPIRVDSITYDSTINVKLGSQQDYLVKLAKPSPISRIRDLADVSALTPQDNDILIYNSDTSKYESNQLTLQNININNIDAGTF